MAGLSNDDREQLLKLLAVWEPRSWWQSLIKQAILSAIKRAPERRKA